MNWGSLPGIRCLALISSEGLKRKCENCVDDNDDNRFNIHYGAVRKFICRGEREPNLTVKDEKDSCNCQKIQNRCFKREKREEIVSCSVCCRCYGCIHGSNYVDVYQLNRGTGFGSARLFQDRVLVQDSGITKNVDTFFIYPTEYMDTNEGDPDYASLDNPGTRDGVKNTITVYS